MMKVTFELQPLDDTQGDVILFHLTYEVQTCCLWTFLIPVSFEMNRFMYFFYYLHTLIYNVLDVYNQEKLICLTSAWFNVI